MRCRCFVCGRVAEQAGWLSDTCASTQAPTPTRKRTASAAAKPEPDRDDAQWMAQARASASADATVEELKKAAYDLYRKAYQAWHVAQKRQRAKVLATAQANGASAGGGTESAAPAAALADAAPNASGTESAAPAAGAMDAPAVPASLALADGTAAPAALAAPLHAKPRGRVPSARVGDRDVECTWDGVDGVWRDPDGSKHVAQDHPERQREAAMRRAVKALVKCAIENVLIRRADAALDARRQAVVRDGRTGYNACTYRRSNGVGALVFYPDGAACVITRIYNGASTTCGPAPWKLMPAFLPPPRPAGASSDERFSNLRSRLPSTISDVRIAAALREECGHAGMALKRIVAETGVTPSDPASSRHDYVRIRNAMISLSPLCTGTPHGERWREEHTLMAPCADHRGCTVFRAPGDAPPASLLSELGVPHAARAWHPQHVLLPRPRPEQVNDPFDLEPHQCLDTRDCDPAIRRRAELERWRVQCDRWIADPENYSDRHAPSSGVTDVVTFLTALESGMAPLAEPPAGRSATAFTAVAAAAQLPPRLQYLQVGDIVLNQGKRYVVSAIAPPGQSEDATRIYFQTFYNYVRGGRLGRGCYVEFEQAVYALQLLDNDALAGAEKALEDTRLRLTQELEES